MSQNLPAPTPQSTPVQRTEQAASKPSIFRLRGQSAMIATAALALLSYGSTFFNFGRYALEALQGYDYLASHNSKSAEFLLWLFSPRGAQLFTFLFLGAFFVAVIRTVSSFQHRQEATVDTLPPELISEAKPNLVLIQTRIADIDTHYNGVASIMVERSNSDNLNTAIVEFANEIGAEGTSARITDLQARITFYDEAGNFYHRVNKGRWVGERFPFINLDVSETAQLILLHRISGNFGKYNDTVKRYHIEDNPNNEEGVSDYSPSKVIDGRKFRAQVMLLCGHQREVIGTYDIELTLEPVFEVKVLPKPPLLS